MKVSKQWLERFFDQPLPRTDAVSDALTFHAFEIDGIEEVVNNEVLDVKITANRGHDCLSHRGIAKELSAILKIPLAHDPFLIKPSASATTVTPEQVRLNEFTSSEELAQAKPPTISVSLKTPLCKRYVAAHIKGVHVGPSPKWLQERLEAIGQRSINNVVDATNFVMFNTGQPLHAFDAGKLINIDGKYALEVRAAHAGETMLALDGKEYSLNESMLVIADVNKGEAIGLAGVKGGMPAGITADTTDIIIESANFDGVTTRKTAAALKLRTDASARFEQVISPELCAHGVRGMLELLQREDMKIGGELVSMVDVYPEPQQKIYVSVTVEHINKVLGTKLTPAEISDVFVRLGLPYKEQSGVFEVQPPYERLDIGIPEDLVEEVGRIVGYDKVPSIPLPAFPGQVEINPEFYAAEKTREELLNQGYSEVLTSVFAETGERTVLNKVDGVKPYLRNTLQTGLLEAWNKNIPNKELLNLKEIKIFEIGTVWKGGKEETHVATVNGKGVVEEKVLELISASAYEPYPISQAKQYKSFSKYPYIVRDVAFWIPQTTDEPAIEVLIKREAGELCVATSLFDRFQKGDKISLGFRLIFQSFDKTLTDAEVNAAMEKVYAALKEKGFEIR